MASASMSMPITKRLLSDTKITSEDNQINKIAKTFLKKLSDKDLQELEKSLTCQGKEATLCVVLYQSDNQR